MVVLALGCTASACGSSTTKDVPTAEVAAPTTTTAPGPRAAARWEDVTTFSGSGPFESPSFTIDTNAIQWKAQWSCEMGSIRIDTIPPPKNAGPFATGTCPTQDEQFSIATGAVHLRLDTAGAWKVTIQQQVDTPIAEQPVAGMDSAPVLEAGDFHNIERPGGGSARIYQLAGQRVLRLDPFNVSPNSELYVWLSEARDPRTSADVVAVPHVELASLKSTIGTQNYVLPDTLPGANLGSVVIWCAPVRIAYIAAPLAAP